MSQLRPVDFFFRWTIVDQRVVRSKKDIDFLPAHACPERSRRIVLLDIWYIVPVEVCTPAPMLRFYPHYKAKQMRLEQYREAWHLVLLQGKKADGPIDIYATADDLPPNLTWITTRPRKSPSSG